MRANPLEADIQAAIVGWLEAAGILHWRVNVAAVPVAGGKAWRKSEIKGHPDLAGVISPGGRYFAIEVKRPKGAKWYPEQHEWAMKLTAAGVLYIVATSVEDVAAALGGLRA